jgi:hypothetical protein
VLMAVAGLGVVLTTTYLVGLVRRVAQGRRASAARAVPARRDAARAGRWVPVVSLVCSRLLARVLLDATDRSSPVLGWHERDPVRSTTRDRAAARRALTGLGVLVARPSVPPAARSSRLDSPSAGLLRRARPCFPLTDHGRSTFCVPARGVAPAVLLLRRRRPHPRVPGAGARSVRWSSYCSRSTRVRESRLPAGSTTSCC